MRASTCISERQFRRFLAELPRSLRSVGLSLGQYRYLEHVLLVSPKQPLPSLVRLLSAKGFPVARINRVIGRTDEEGFVNYRAVFVSAPMRSPRLDGSR